MTPPGVPTRSFPELERLERAAIAYAWSMFSCGIGVGFALAWMVCAAPSCELPREPVAPRAVASAPSSVRAVACRRHETTEQRTGMACARVRDAGVE